MPLTTTFRAGEMETMGVIEKVGYKPDGNSVVVTMTDGMMKDSSIRYTIVSGSATQAKGMAYQEVAN